jgi:hypothetical protein
MSGLFAHRDGTADPWFRIGRLQVTTVLIVVACVIASWIAWVVLADRLLMALYFEPSIVPSGPWRVATWPFANGLSLWGILNLFFFWYFGSDLEAGIGRKRMALLLLGIWASLTGSATVIGLLGGTLMLAGIGLIQVIILLVWIGESPTRRLIFNIPAWAFGLVILSFQVLTLIAYRQIANLLSLLLSLVFVALIAKRLGLLAGVRWIPGGPRRPKAGKAPRQRSTRTERASARAAAQQMSDRDRLDQLLDLINEQGIHSLSDTQRRELMRLRDRLRGQ